MLLLAICHYLLHLTVYTFWYCTLHHIRRARAPHPFCAHGYVRTGIHISNPRPGKKILLAKETSHGGLVQNRR